MIGVLHNLCQWCVGAHRLLPPRCRQALNARSAWSWGGQPCMAAKPSQLGDCRSLREEVRPNDAPARQSIALHTWASTLLPPGPLAATPSLYRVGHADGLRRCWRRDQSPGTPRRKPSSSLATNLQSCLMDEHADPPPGDAQLSGDARWDTTLPPLLHRGPGLLPAHRAQPSPLTNLTRKRRREPVRHTMLLELPIGVA